jgi:hypothetical protein
MAEIKLTIPDDLVAEICGQTGLKNASEVAKEAVTVFNWAVKEAKSNRVVCSVDSKGKSPLILAMRSLDHARALAAAGLKP